MSDITVNNKPLDEHLQDEKVKEVIYDVHIQIRTRQQMIYKKPSGKVRTKARSGKTKVIKDPSEIFIVFLESLPEDIQDGFIFAKRFQQDRIWDAWTKGPQNAEQLEKIIRRYTK
jgi:hypothetical protein